MSDHKVLDRDTLANFAKKVNKEGASSCSVSVSFKDMSEDLTSFLNNWKKICRVVFAEENKKIFDIIGLNRDEFITECGLPTGFDTIWKLLPSGSALDIPYLIKIGNKDSKFWLDYMTRLLQGSPLNDAQREYHRQVEMIIDTTVHRECVEEYDRLKSKYEHNIQELKSEIVANKASLESCLGALDSIDRVEGRRYPSHLSKLMKTRYSPTPEEPISPPSPSVYSRPTSPPSAPTSPPSAPTGALSAKSMELMAKLEAMRREL